MFYLGTVLNHLLNFWAANAAKPSATSDEMTLFGVVLQGWVATGYRTSALSELTFQGGERAKKQGK